MQDVTAGTMDPNLHEQFSYVPFSYFRNISHDGSPPLLLLLTSHALPCLPAFIEFPRHIGQALAFGLADAIRVLGIEANLAVLIDDLRMQGEAHVFFESH